MQSLTTGFFQQTATAASSDAHKGQFFITDQYLSNPTRASLHKQCTLLGAAGSFGTVLFFSHTLLADGRHELAGVGKIQPDWVVAAASFDPQLASSLGQTMQATMRDKFNVIVTCFPTMVSLSVYCCNGAPGLAQLIFSFALCRIVGSAYSTVMHVDFDKAFGKERVSSGIVG